MRKFVLAIALAAATALGGCSTTSGITSTETSVILGDIQTGCGYVADAADVAALIASYPPLTLATTIATAFCQAVQAIPASAKFKAAAGPGVVVVNGVPVHYAPLGTHAAARLKSSWK
jgi:hypothetical protein